MKIYRMTATFGKLEHETLTLEPGLNIITAPNEWGKSTWCAFLTAMLYGMDTRAKSTKTVLADKERYVPWSGSPMAGRIDLNWNGRDITIERTTRGRTPLGEFRAYETASGLAVPELTGANCGLMLLGVEQSVFRRTAFLRQQDMPVTQDEALRRRLNDLVTTGDESGDADRLAQQLRELKNRCRYNRTGLIPQTESQWNAVEEKIAEWESLEAHSRSLKQRLGELKSWQRTLENHRDALRYAAAEADAARVADAREAADRAEKKLFDLEADCRGLPSREETERKEKALRVFCTEWNEAQLEQALMPAKPKVPELPERFRDQSRKQAEETIRADRLRLDALKKERPWVLPFVLAGILLGIAAGVVWFDLIWAAGICLVLGLTLLIFGFTKKGKHRRRIASLMERYDGEAPELWHQPLLEHDRAMEEYRQQLESYRHARVDMDIRMTFLQKQKDALCGSRKPEAVLEFWQQGRKRWESYDAACREARQAQKYLQTLQAMVKPVSPPLMADALTCSEGETLDLIREAQADQQRLLGRLGQYQGRMEALGDLQLLEKERNTLHQRLEKLEQIYEALDLALDTLEQTRQELQRRFAPRIARRAKELLETITSGRYDRLTLDADFSLLSGAQGEDTLHGTLWRSDGTVDQLYVALRLAVAEELMPEVPLILDDAFVRFDDARLKAILGILKQQAEGKQVILFTCQSREKELV